MVRRVGSVTAVVAGVLLALMVGAAPAHAHNSLSDSTPKDGAVLDAAPATVNLKFLATLPPQGTTVTITDPSGASAVAGTATFDGPTVMVPLRPTVAGLYTVDYRVPSTDGHPVTGKVRFTLTAAAVPAPPSGPASPTPAGPEPASAEPTAEPGVLPGDPPSGSAPWLPWLVAAGALLVVTGLALTIYRRRASAA